MTTQTDATQPGVSTVTYEQPEEIIADIGGDKPEVFEGRDAVEEAAAKKGRAAQDAKLREAMGLPPEEVQEPAGESTDVGEGQEQPQVQETQEQAEQRARDDKGRFASTKPATEDDPLVTVKVDGVEQQIPLSEVRAGYQRASAANKRFEEAAQQRAQAEELFRRVQQPAPQAQPNPAPQAPSPAPGGVPDVDLGQIAEALTYGTKDDVLAALTKVIGTRQQGATPDQIAQVVQQSLGQFQQQTEARRELETFSGTHADLANDPDLSELVGRRAAGIMGQELIDAGAPPSVVATLTPMQIGQYHQQLRQMNRGRSAQEILGEAATQIRRKFNLPVQSAAPSPSRVDAKRQAPKQPAAVNARATPPQAPKPKTASQIIAEDRAARGLT